MAYLRCPECLYTNTLKKADVPTAICGECGFEVGKYYSDERSSEELKDFIRDENSRLKKTQDKKKREYRKQQQNFSNQIEPDSIQSDTNDSSYYFWRSVNSKIDYVIWVYVLILTLGAFLRLFYSDFLEGFFLYIELDIWSVRIDRYFYTPVLRGLFESIINTNAGLFYDLRYFLLSTSRGALVLTFSLISIVAYVLSILSSNLADRIANPVQFSVIFLGFFQLTLAIAPNQVNIMGLFIMLLVVIGFSKLANKILG